MTWGVTSVTYVVQRDFLVRIGFVVPFIAENCKVCFAFCLPEVIVKSGKYIVILCEGRFCYLN